MRMQQPILQQCRGWIWLPGNRTTFGRVSSSIHHMSPLLHRIRPIYCNSNSSMSFGTWTYSTPSASGQYCLFAQLWTANGTNLGNDVVCFNYIYDADSDGVWDENDLCPNTPIGSTVDSNGCASASEIRMEMDTLMMWMISSTIRPNGTTTMETDMETMPMVTIPMHSHKIRHNGLMQMVMVAATIQTEPMATNSQMMPHNVQTSMAMDGVTIQTDQPRCIPNRPNTMV